MPKVFNPQPEQMPGVTEVSEMLRRAQQGDATVMPELREFLDARAELWREVGDVAAVAREAVLKLAAGSDLMIRECISRVLDEMHGELAGPEPSPLERLLVERVLTTWLQLHLADLDATTNDRPGSPLASDARKRQESAQRRYLGAVKQLALVRKLLKPAISPVELAMRTAPGPSSAARPTRPASRREGAPVLN
jgi:hypothetical protein